jgi:hypothetical protein
MRTKRRDEETQPNIEITGKQKESKENRKKRVVILKNLTKLPWKLRENQVAEGSGNVGPERRGSEDAASSKIPIILLY